MENNYYDFGTYICDIHFSIMNHSHKQSRWILSEP